MSVLGGGSNSGDDRIRPPKRGDSEDDGDEWARTMELLKESDSVGSLRKHAYSLFEHLDVDGDHRISSWELARHLPSAIGCTREDKVELSFFCTKLGLTVEEDEQGNVIVAGWEEDSAAANHASLMVGMKILSIDGWDLPCALKAAAAASGTGTTKSGGTSRLESSLRKCESVLEDLHGEENELHVLEVAMPAVVVTKSNAWLDMEVGGDVVAVRVPLGIYATMQAYCSALQEAGRDQHPTELKYFGVKSDATQPFVAVTAGFSPFSILWQSGEHRSENCRRILRFSGEQDTDVKMSHMSRRWDTFEIDGTNQRLNLKPGALTDFAEHLILKVLETHAGSTTGSTRSDDFSLDGAEGAALEFEEFCTLHSMYLSSQEGLWRARDLVMMGFMGTEERAQMAEQQAVDDMRRRRLRKMLKTRKINKERKRLQLSRIRDARKNASRRRGADYLQKKKQGNDAPETTSAPEAAAAEVPLPSIDHTGDQEGRSSEDRANSPDEIVGGNGDVVSFRTRAVCSSSNNDVGAAKSDDGLDGGQVPRVTKAVGRGAKAGYSDDVLAERKAHLLSQRDRTKAIKRSQEKAIKARLLRSINETRKFEEELGGAEQWGTSKRSVELAKLGLEDCRSGQAGKRPHPEDIHPAFLGYFHRPRSPKAAWNPTVRSPVFFGKLSGGLTRLEAVRGEGNLAALKAILGGAAFAPPRRRRPSSQERAGLTGNISTCLTFPLAPTTRGKVRQRLRQAGEAYDRAGVVHPSCFGLMTIPDNQDCRHLSPVFFGYDLVKKPRSRAGALPDDEVPQREDFVTHRKGKPCPVCLVGKPGCPCCWDFPEGFVPHDFAYLGPFVDNNGGASQRSSRPASVGEGGSVCSLPTLGSGVTSKRGTPDANGPVGNGMLLPPASGGKRQGEEGEKKAEVEKPELHTDLTTSAAITLYRTIVGSIIRIFVKVIPCGTATTLWMDSSWPVSYLYDLWRANAAEGYAIDAFMFLPTMTGQWNLDNRNLPETDTTRGVHTGNLPISTYNLTTPRSSVTVLCTTFLSALKNKKNIERYLVYETGIGKHAVLEVFDHLVGCPKHPENDPVQKVLCSLMEYRTAQQELVDDDDDSAEVKKRNRMLLDAEKARKEAALAEKRKQVAYGSREWKTARRNQLLQEEAAAAAAAALSGEEAYPSLPLAHSSNNGGRQGDETGRDSGRDDGANPLAKGGGSGRGVSVVGARISKLNLSFKASKKKLIG
eukprot:g7422.t1